LSPLYQLFSSALPRKILGTLGTINVLLPSYPVNKCIMLYRVHLASAGFKLTTLVVIYTDCIDSYKSNY
jgi:energy-converting hydrogenase Eha subunit C